MKTDPNECAFPVVGRDSDLYESYGLTKKEEFSARIMAGFAADPMSCNQFDNANQIAKTAIKWADALIEELNK